MALLQGAEALARAGVRIGVATVDHGLRPEAAAEAAGVAAAARRRGFPHWTLCWTGPKPATGLPAAARRARYRLLADCAERQGFGAIATGHTLDDQAETLWMRLARGAGEGLGAMAPLSRIAAGPGRPVKLWRPFLDLRRADLRAALDRAQIAYVDDPSNDDPAYERPRVRALLAEGGVDVANLTLSAARIREAAAARGRETSAAFDRARGVFHHWGGASFSAGGVDETTAGALFAAAIWAVSGTERRPDANDAARALETMRAQKTTPGRTSLGGAILERRNGAIVVYREPAALLGRTGAPAIAPTPIAPTPIAPGERALWDGRFIVENAAAAMREIAPYGALADDHDPGSASFAGPRAALASVPALVPASDPSLASAGGRFGDGVASPVYGADPTFRSLAAERFFAPVTRF